MTSLQSIGNTNNIKTTEQEVEEVEEVPCVFSSIPMNMNNHDPQQPQHQNVVHGSNILIPLSDPIVFYIGYSTKGRGLFATIDILPQTMIHIAPCIPIIRHEYETYMKYTILEEYVFNDISSGNKLLALGYGSLFNHSNQPNISYTVNYQQQMITYTSGYQRIPKDTELCISYGANLWFHNTEQSDNHNNSDDEHDNDESFLHRIDI